MKSSSNMAGSTPLQTRELDDENESSSSSMRTAETLLRLLPMGLCIVALVIMLKNSQTNEYGSISYSDLGTFSGAGIDLALDMSLRCSDRRPESQIRNDHIARYLVHANGICAGYSLLSAIVAVVPRPVTMSRAWTFFLLDQILTYVILAAGAVSTEVVYLAYKGDTAVTWSESCGSFRGFCHKATASVSITFIVCLCYAGLSLLSSYRLFSKYEAPVESYNNSNKGGIEIANY